MRSGFGTAITANQVNLSLSNVVSYQGNINILYGFNIQSGIAGTPTQNTGSFTFPDGTNAGGGGPNAGAWVEFYNGSGTQVTLPKIILGGVGGFVNLNQSIPSETIQVDPATAWDLIPNGGSSLTVNGYLDVQPGATFG